MAKKRRKAKPKAKHWTFLGIAAAISLLVIIVTYGYIDRKVELRLSIAQQSVLSGIYSRSLSVVEGDKISTPILRQALLERKYTESPEKIDNPGEFQQNGEELHFITRSFPSPLGGLIKPSEIIFDGSSGKIENKSAPQKKSFTLEPLLISPLGAGEQRVSRQKRLSEIPEHLRNAFLAIEDQRFYSHSGIDLYGIGRAFLKNLAALSWVQGGSTITQQLAKNILFTSKRSLSRKILEIFAAFSLERRLSKDQIFEMYLNEVYFGQFGSIAVHGVGEAAITFFGKKVEDLTLSESALLAGLVRAPSYYSPRKHLKRALERRDLVLDSMQEAGFANEADINNAKTFKINILKNIPFQRKAPHFAATLRSDLSNEMDIDNAIASGIAVYTGLDSRMQDCAENAVTSGVEQIEKNYPGLKKKKKPVEAALVAIEPFTGLVKAWAGGRDYGENQFDHVYQALRQVGSTIKPFLYLTALDSTLNDYKIATPLSILSDEPMRFKLVTKQIWIPENYDKQFRGDVTLRYALENSLNMPALYVAERVGIPAVARTVQSFHLADQVPKVPALALGALDTTLFRLTAAYAALANGGRYVAPRLFSSATDSDGNVLSQRKMQEEVLASEDAVFVLTNILQGVIKEGTAKSAARLGYTGHAAGKTGTSNEARDAWFEGFTPDLAVGVWVGFDDNTPIGLTGGVAALPIWVNFKKCIEGFNEELQFLKPPGVVFVDIDQNTQDIATEYSEASAVIKEAFVKGTEPIRAEGPQEQEMGTEETSEGVKTSDEEAPFWEGWFN
ncbi:MAG: PBP1A family penicillin-binding protein [SAR324 cluster bacterium]|uniref:PBP1A family penicillin-binding protein n=1 Tax=SAR324 cluster bacterium TaxID=2024889 RepID=A0A7X9IL36_9DELT|nr:PBP1A family penicillin-binding protein [SAR324 cluster bacterium]